MKSSVQGSAHMSLLFKAKPHMRSQEENIFDTFLLVLTSFNLFTPNGHFYFNSLDRSISNTRGFCLFFYIKI